MKLSTLITGLLIVFCLWVAFPLLFVWLNDTLSWPVLDFSWLKLGGVILIVLSLVTDLYLLGLFRFFGGGSPVPIDPAARLISQGPYQYTRNPMYLSHFVLVLGEFLLFGYLTLLMYLLFLIAGLHLFVKYWEEPDLESRLGSSYTRYLTKVPRWLA